LTTESNHYDGTEAKIIYDEINGYQGNAETKD
jgi:hypothetical protein